MATPKTSTFPDPSYLEALIRRLREKVEATQSPAEALIMYSGAALNWIADYVTDEHIRWSRETLPLDKLWLTGTNPEWNKIIIDRCERSPRAFRALLSADPAVAAMFAEAVVDDTPILVRHEDEAYKVLDGMLPVIAAIRDGRSEIETFMATLAGTPRPQCEPHVVYDLIRAYHRKLNQDRAGLIAALRFLRHSYGNVDDLLRQRFNKPWVPDDEIQEIIREVLAD